MTWVDSPRHDARDVLVQTAVEEEWIVAGGVSHHVRLDRCPRGVDSVDMSINSR